jgi:hypothetical protein
MDKLVAIIDQREKGAVPVSIGTSLAIEGAAGAYPDRPENPAPILKVKEVWFNIRTIIRNLVESIPTDQRDALTAEALWPALVEEVTIIEAAIVRASTGMARAVFYLCNYLHLQRKFPKAVLRQANTPKQIKMRDLEEGLLRRIGKEGISVDYRVFNSHEITGHHPESFILTHYPVDLLARYAFKKLELLESHTGIVKGYTQWHTKLTGGNEHDNIPFCALTLQVFGDKGNHFAAMSSRLKKAVLDVAASENWSSVTTRDKMLLSFRKVEDPTDRATLISML